MPAFEKALQSNLQVASEEEGRWQTNSLPHEQDVIGGITHEAQILDVGEGISRITCTCIRSIVYVVGS